MGVVLRAPQMLGATDCVHRDAVAQRYFDDISSYLSVYFTTIGLVARRRPLEYGLRDLFGNALIVKISFRIF